MPDRCFRAGDRVRVGASTFFRAGRLGTVIQSFSGEDDLLDVQFDDAADPCLMLVSELELAYSTSDAELRERVVGG